MRLLITDPFPRDLVEGGRRHYDVTYRPDIGYEELLQIAGDYDVMVVRSRTKVDREVIRRAGRLRAVVTATHGIDHVDVDELRKRGITFHNIAEQNNAVAEMAFALLLALVRGLIPAVESTRRSEWKKDEIIGTELRGKTLGIAGYGKIGRRMGEIATQGLSMNVQAYDKYLPDEVVAEARRTNVQMVDFETLLRASDVIAITLPLTAETRDLIGSKEFSLMKKGVYMIIISRGGIVDEEALLNALDEGKVAGAGIDVFAREPPDGNLIAHPMVIPTPHIGGQTRETRESAARKLLELLADIARSN